MPPRSEVYYFGAGPAALPTPVLETASAAILNHEDTGIGLIEQSHRSPSSTIIIYSAVSNLRELLSIPPNYTVLFMQGGGTTQFSAVVYNLLGYWVQSQLAANNNDLAAVQRAIESAKVDYLLTGSWSKKATEEAQRLLGEEHVNVATDSRNLLSTKKFGSIAAETEWTLTPVENSIFTYYCDNETVDGVEFPSFPVSLGGRLVACDMSSNILSRHVDVSKYAVLYAGAQKNVGSAGVTIVVVRDDIIKNQPNPATLRKLGLPIPPVMMHYPTLAAGSSLYNTLPIFDVFICREVMAALLSRGGLEAQEKLANEKAQIIYAVLEKNGIYKIVPKEGSRSRMNICFRIEGGEDVEKAFLKAAEHKGLTGLKGHRSVGGLRISNYNSVSKEAAEKLASFVTEFAEQRR